MTDTTKTAAPLMPSPAHLELPRGVGIFFRHLSHGHEPPSVVAARCKQNGIRWATLMALSLEHLDGEDVHRTAEFADVLDRAGVAPFIWIFPKASTPLEQILKVVDTHLKAFPYRGIIVDVELPYAGKPKALDDLLRAIRSRLVARQSMICTSYAVRAYHKTIPWDVLAMHCDQMLFQAYEEVTPGQAQDAAESFRKIFASVGAVGPAYGIHSGHELAPYLDACYLKSGKLTIDALGVWSWPQLDMREWPVFHAYAKRFEP